MFSYACYKLLDAWHQAFTKFAAFKFVRPIVGRSGGSGGWLHDRLDNFVKMNAISQLNNGGCNIYD